MSMTFAGPFSPRHQKYSKPCRAMFVLGKQISTGEHPVYLSRTRSLVGYVFEPDGKGAGWKWRLEWATHRSKAQYKSASLAILAMGEKI